jgi:tetratricopeptide (TPR) repeat protein
MVFSKKYNFLYIAVPKTGSINFQSALSYHSDLTLIRGAHLAGKIYSHIRADQFFDIFPSNVIGHPFTFSIMRSPFSWAVSSFNYGSRKELQSPAHSKNHRRSQRDYSFDQFLSFWEENAKSKKTQSDFLFLDDGSPLDAILRLENIHDDIKPIKHKLPNDFDVDACFKKQLNKSVNVSMSVSKLTKSHKQRLEVLLAKDIELYESLPYFDISENTKDNKECRDEDSVEILKWLDENRPIVAAEGCYSKAMNQYREGENETALELFEKARYLHPGIAGLSGRLLLLYRVLGLEARWETEQKMLEKARHIHPRIAKYSELIISFCGVLGLKSQWITALENHSNSEVSDAIMGYETAYWKYNNREFKAAYELILNILAFSEGRPKDFLLLARTATNLSSAEVEIVAQILKEARTRFSDNMSFPEILSKIDRRYN